MPDGSALRRSPRGVPGGLSRRRVLGTLAGTAVAGAAGCAAAPVRIAVPWSGWELARFRDVMRDYPGDAVVFSAGDSIDALLKNPVARSARPGVAFVPRIGLLGDAAAGLRSMPAAIPGVSPSAAATAHPPAGAAAWTKLIVHDGEVKGVWFKAAHKSLLWHHGPDKPPCGADPAEPASWSAWTAYLRTAPRPLLSIGAADGWVLTDWFENVLLGIDPAVYRGLLPAADGRAGGAQDWGASAVTQALEHLRDVWGLPGVFPGGGHRALLTSFHDSILDVFYYRHARVVAAADFAYPLIARYGTPAPIPMPCRFPAEHPGAAPVLVAGDAAVALSDAGRGVVSWLAGEGGRDAVRGKWVRDGGFISLDARVTGYPAALQPFTGQVVGGDVEFDLSDQLTGRLSGGNGRGLWRVLTRFFSDVTGVTHSADPVKAAQDAMMEAAG